MNRTMIRTVTFGIALFLLAFGVTFTQLQAQAGPGARATRVGVCNIPEIFDKYNRAQQLTEELKERTNKLKAENDRRVDTIRIKQTELEGLMPESPEYNKRLQEIQELTIERQVWLKMQEDLMMRDHLRLTRELYKDIKDSVARVAKARGFDIVIQFDPRAPEGNSSQEIVQQIDRRKVLYSDEQLDITAGVLQDLNERFRTGN
jgi:Skp family chaperone for outer membrane proteins